MRKLGIMGHASLFNLSHVSSLEPTYINTFDVV